MKITEDQLRRIIKESLLVLERTSPGPTDFFGKVGKFIDTGSWGNEKIDPRKHRHPKLNAIIDVVNDAIGEVPHAEMKSFLWALNSDYANKGRIMEARLSESGHWGSYAEKGPGFYRDVIIMSPNADSVLVDGNEVMPDTVPEELEFASGWEMDASSADALIAEIEKQFRTGFVELTIEFRNGNWSW